MTALGKGKKIFIVFSFFFYFYFIFFFFFSEKKNIYCGYSPEVKCPQLNIFMENLKKNIYLDTHSLI